MERETIQALRRSWLTAESDSDFREKELSILIGSMKIVKKTKSAIAKKTHSRRLPRLCPFEK